MAAAKSLEELVAELPAEERKQLYNRIRKSLSLHEQSDQKIYHSELPQNRRAELIRREMSALGLWQRFVFWLTRLFSRKSDEETFLGFRLRQLRNTVRRSGNLIDFEQRTAQPELARRVYEFWKIVEPIIPMFNAFWKNPDFLQRMISYLLEKRIPSAKTDLNQFMSMKEMQDLFMRTENKQAIKKEVLGRIEQYLKSLQPDVFAHLEEGVLPLYFMKSVCLFPYERFFERFGASPGPPGDGKEPVFNTVFALEVVDLLEQLYYAFYSARRVPEEVSVHQELFEYYVTRSGDDGETYDPTNPAAYGDAGDAGTMIPTEDDAVGMMPATSPDAASSTEPQAMPPPRFSQVYGRASRGRTDAVGPSAEGGALTERDQARVSILRQALRATRKAIEDLQPRIRLVETIKYFHEDPYYRFLVYVPRLDLREYYASSLTAGVMSQAERRFSDVRMGVIGRMITRIFGTEPPDFEYYRPTTFSSVKVTGIPTVRFVKSLNILYNYIRLHYFGELQDFVRELVQVISARYRDLQANLQFHSGALEDVAEKIRAFDRSFSPDSDEGKSLQRLRVGMEKDPGLQRTYRITLAQKDREARTLVDKGQEHILGIQTSFADLVNGADQAFMQRLASVTAPGEGGRPMDTVLAEYVETFGFLRKLINQLLALEEGY